MGSLTRTGCIVVGGLLGVSAIVQADPVVLRPVSFLEIVDEAPIDGRFLRDAVAQNVALGPSAETRVFYQFALPALRSALPTTWFFSVKRGSDVFSECASLSPCPDLTRVNIFGYAGTGSITLADYNAGSLLGSVTRIPERGGTISLDVTNFISGLLSANSDFGGVVLRPGSLGALEFTDAQIAATPEPGSLTLLTLAGFAAAARKRARRAGARSVLH